MFIIISLVSCLLLTNCNAYKSYKNHLLVQGFPKSDIELYFFNKLGIIYNATFWREPTLIYKPVQFSITSLDFETLINDTKGFDMEFVILIRDLQSAFDNQTVKLYTKQKIESFDWNNYYSVESIYNWLKDLSELHPDKVRVESIGRSYQKRHIYALRVQLESEDKIRSTIVIEGGCHAREWISPAFVTYMINTIVNAENPTNAEFELIAKSYVWYFIPLLNPDGYSYSQTTDRLWRKNLHGGYGVDLNRNFNIEFGKFDATTTDKSSPVYCGERPFSEPETKALATFLERKAVNLDYYIAFHSYGQYIYIPYEVTTTQEYFDNYEEVKKRVDKVITRFARKYEVYYKLAYYEMPGHLSSGVSTDWVKSTLKVPYVVKINLPDKAAYGFALPSDSILSTCKSTMDSILPFLAPKSDSEFFKRSALESGAEGHKSYTLLRLTILPIVLNILI